MYSNIFQGHPSNFEITQLKQIVDEIKIAKLQYIMTPYVAPRSHNDRMVSNLPDAIRNTKKIYGFIQIYGIKANLPAARKHAPPCCRGWRPLPSCEDPQWTINSPKSAKRAVVLPITIVWNLEGRVREFSLVPTMLSQLVAHTIYFTFNLILSSFTIVTTKCFPQPQQLTEVIVV